MTDDRAVRLAVELRRLNVSHAGIVDLLAHHPHDVIERQLAYLPYRKAKRKEAFIVDAIRNDYSPPKQFFYAAPETPPSEPIGEMDEDAESASGQAHAGPQRYGAAGAARAPQGHHWLEPSGFSRDLELPDSSTEDGPQ